MKDQRVKIYNLELTKVLHEGIFKGFRKDFTVKL
jgi:hypothetical protein